MIRRLQCLRCKHFLGSDGGYGYRCVAYPEHIPDTIVAGDHNHREPFPGDQGILFEQKEAEPAKPPAQQSA